MQIRLQPPSELDCKIDRPREESTICIMRPVFYQRNGTAIIGTMQVTSDEGKVLDRAVITVSGNGNINVSHRNKEVVPMGDLGGNKNGGSNKSGAGNGASADAASADSAHDG